MQGAYLIITIGIEFFLLVGYMFYLLFRTYAVGEDRISMLRWLIGIIGLLTVGLIVSVALVATRMTNTDLVLSIALLLVDVVGLYLIIGDSRKLSQKILLAEQT